MCYKNLQITSTNYLAIGKSTVIITQIALCAATIAFFGSQKKLKFFYNYINKLCTKPKLFVRFYFIPHYEYK